MEILPNIGTMEYLFMVDASFQFQITFFINYYQNETIYVILSYVQVLMFLTKL